jgi:hypothetical protein
MAERVGGHCHFVRVVKSNNKKVENIICPGLRWLPFDKYTHNNQLKILVRNGGVIGEEV